MICQKCKNKFEIKDFNFETSMCDSCSLKWLEKNSKRILYPGGPGGSHEFDDLNKTKSK